MNNTSTQLIQTLSRLKTALGTLTPQQRAILAELKAQIRENGRFYEVSSASLTVPLMREHGYDVTEKDAPVLCQIAEHVQVDADMLWDSVAVWAREYNVKSIEEEEEQEEPQQPLPAKELWAFVFPDSRLERNATDAQILADYQQEHEQDELTVKFTPDEFAAYCNDGFFNDLDQHVRFIYTE